MDNKEVFDRFSDRGFIKTGTQTKLDSTVKAALNRKGNLLFNSGDIEGARRIFITTGYSDGLTRVGDFYSSKGRAVEALKMYWIAPDKKKAQELISRMAVMIQNLMLEEEVKYE